MDDAHKQRLRIYVLIKFIEKIAGRPCAQQITVLYQQNAAISLQAQAGKMEIVDGDFAKLCKLLQLIF